VEKLGFHIDDYQKTYYFVWELDKFLFALGSIH
jgi:hypothetical protein